MRAVIARCRYAYLVGKVQAVEEILKTGLGAKGSPHRLITRSRSLTHLGHGVAGVSCASPTHLAALLFEFARASEDARHGVVPLVARVLE